MGLFGDLVQQALGGFPTKPSAPPAPNVNPQSAQRDAISGNQAALPGLEDLASATNTFNTGQGIARREAAAPGINRNIASESDLLNNWLSGVLSPDVASAVRGNANARSFAGGYGGSGMADALQARDLGLTSLDLQKMGVGAMPGFVSASQAGIPAPFNPAAGFISPMEQIAAQQWNESNRYGRDWLQNQLDSIPDPARAAIAKDVGGMADTVGSMIPYFGAFYSMSGNGPASASGAGAGGGFGSLFGGGGGAGGGMFDAISGMGVG